MKTELSPLADYSDYLDAEKPTPRENAVWACVLDKKFGVEVQRTDGAAYSGVLCVFDLPNDAKLVHSEPVTISHGAIFGPDVVDVETWQNKVVEIVDALPAV